MKMLANKCDDVTNAVGVGSLYMIRFDRGLHVMIVWALVDSLFFEYVYRKFTFIFVINICLGCSFQITVRNSNTNMYRSSAALWICLIIEQNSRASKF
jgi:hypothetical protein